jgi:hypothetical protein
MHWIFSTALNNSGTRLAPWCVSLSLLIMARTCNQKKKSTMQTVISRTVPTTAVCAISFEVGILNTLTSETYLVHLTLPEKRVSSQSPAGYSTIATGSIALQLCC